MNHMQTRHTLRWSEKIHTERWHCDFDHTDPPEYEDKNEFLSHLTTEHGNRLTTSQLQGRARRNKMICTRDPFVCPLCDCIPDSLKGHIAERPYKLLFNHVSHHLISLSFLSLSYLDINFESVDSTDGSGSTGKPKQHELSLLFDSTSPRYNGESVRDGSYFPGRRSRKINNPGTYTEPGLESQLQFDERITDVNSPSILQGPWYEVLRTLGPSDSRVTNAATYPQIIPDDIRELQDSDFEDNCEYCIFYLNNPYVHIGQPWTSCGRPRAKMSHTVQHVVMHHGLVRGRNEERPSQRYLTRCSNHDPEVKGKWACEHCENVDQWTDADLTETAHSGESVCLRCYAQLLTKAELFNHLKEPTICLYQSDLPLKRKSRVLYSVFCEANVVPRFRLPLGCINELE